MLRFVRSLAVLGVAVAVVGGASLAHADTVIFVRGDANGSGQVDGADLAALMAYLATGRSITTLEALDVDDNGRIDRLDAIALHRAVRAPRPSMPQIAEFVRGDATGDRLIDMRDVRALQNYLFGGRSYSIGSRVQDAADVNGDLRIDVLDLIALVRMAAPAPTPVPPPTT